MLLEVKGLIVHYGKAEVIKTVSVNVDQGEIVTLIGANGAGKTTLLRTISGLKKLTSGGIWFQGDAINGLASHKIARLRIAHVPEGRRVLAPMTVLENLEMGAYPCSQKRVMAEGMEHIYKYFPVLKERRYQKAGSLSGGEQQMLAIARALMGQPKLLLMDEPTMGLSPLLVGEVARIIVEINRAGVSIILVEQNARMALSLAERAYVLETGKVVLQGVANDLAGDERVKEAYLGG